MPPFAATTLVLAGIAWLLWNDRRRHGPTSVALWIPTMWMFIIGSRPISIWLGGPVTIGGDAYLEGSPFDRLFFLSLIVAGFVVLLARAVDVRAILSGNRWIVIYLLYLGVSVLWSEYTFVSFKRWVKDVGNVIMVMVVLSDPRPMRAIQAMLLRCSFLLIPLSVLLVKYYPALGRYYDRWTYKPYFGGVTTDKNLLGMVLFFCGLTLFWFVLQAWERRRVDRVSPIVYGALLLMTVWLLRKAHSSTAMICLAMGMSVLFALRFDGTRRRVGPFVTGFILSVAAILVLHFTFNIGEVIVALLGRDLTLTGRTEIWAALLEEDVNPILGVGFYSFWLGDRIDRISERYYYNLNEAHNGYLETYLNSGLLGVALLCAVFVSCFARVRLEVMARQPLGTLKLAMLLVTAVYNVTEAAFDRLNILWFGFLLLMMRYPRARSARVRTSGEAEVVLDRDQPFPQRPVTDALPRST